MDFLFYPIQQKAIKAAECFVTLIENYILMNISSVDILPMGWYLNSHNPTKGPLTVNGTMTAIEVQGNQKHKVPFKPLGIKPIIKSQQFITNYLICTKGNTWDPILARSKVYTG